MYNRRIYALSDLPPEVKAVAFAKCSRSPDQIDKIAKELDEDKSRKFHEKWVVGYGHSSVAEHAVLSIAIENVSILATKVIEDNRLASYTEKSTRYQVFDKDKYFKPDLGKYNQVYSETCDFILNTYSRLNPLMINFFKKKFPKESESMIKNMALDCLRYILPVSMQTTLGMTVNARNLEYGIMKLLSHPFKEMRDIGKEIKEAAIKITPTLIKYTQMNQYLTETKNELKKISNEALKEGIGKNKEGVLLVEFDEDAENKLITALLYRFSNRPYEQIMEQVKKLGRGEKERIIDESLNKLGKYDRPLREFEYVYYTFDVLMDYGGFRDVQRHRMCTQTNQAFSVEDGYQTPIEIVVAGFENDFKDCMEKAKKTFKEISKEFPNEAQYIIPMAYNKRLLMKMNLRELFHFIKLRSGTGSHISYKKIAQQMYNEIKRVHPFIAKYIQCDMS
ncbi:MAG: FAD-dependent thymidylate synthase [Nanoarchaeota archaeon]